MGLWHSVEYYEKEKVVGEEFYQQWSNVSIKNSSFVAFQVDFEGTLPIGVASTFEF